MKLSSLLTSYVELNEITIMYEKSQVLNTLPLLQRSHSVEIIAPTRGRRYEVTKPLRIRRRGLTSFAKKRNRITRRECTRKHRYVNTRSI